MSRQYVTCPELQYVKTLSGSLAGNCFPTGITQQTLLALNNVTLTLSPDEITQLFSALMAGADILYPEQSHHVHWLFWRALDCPYQRVLFQDNYVFAESAPIASPRVSKPLGNSVITQLNSGALKIENGDIVVSAVTTSGAAGDLEQETAELFDRAPGLAFLATFRRPTALSGEVRIGFSDDTDTARRGATFRFNGSQIRTYAFGIQTNLIGTMTAGVDYHIAVILQSGRVFYFLLGGAFTDWTLVSISRRYTSTTDIIASHMHITPHIGDAVSRMRVVNLGANFQSENGIALFSELTLSASDTLAVPADFAIDCEAGVISATDKVLAIRVQDANNYWRIVMNTTATELYEVVAGVQTLRGSGAPLANDDSILLLAYGATIEMHHSNVQFFKYTSAANFQTETTLTHLSGATLDLFSVYARVASAIDSLELSLS